MPIAVRRWCETDSFYCIGWSVAIEWVYDSRSDVERAIGCDFRCVSRDFIHHVPKKCHDSRQQPILRTSSYVAHRRRLCVCVSKASTDVCRLRLGLVWSAEVAAGPGTVTIDVRSGEQMVFDQLEFSLGESRLFVKFPPADPSLTTSLTFGDFRMLNGLVTQFTASGFGTLNFTSGWFQLPSFPVRRTPPVVFAGGLHVIGLIRFDGAALQTTIVADSVVFGPNLVLRGETGLLLRLKNSTVLSPLELTDDNSVDVVVDGHVLLPPIVWKSIHIESNATLTLDLSGIGGSTAFAPQIYSLIAHAPCTLRTSVWPNRFTLNPIVMTFKYNRSNEAIAIDGFKLSVRDDFTTHAVVGNNSIVIRSNATLNVGGWSHVLCPSCPGGGDSTGQPITMSGVVVNYVTDDRLPQSIAGDLLLHQSLATFMYPSAAALARPQINVFVCWDNNAVTGLLPPGVLYVEPPLCEIPAYDGCAVGPCSKAGTENCTNVYVPPHVICYCNLGFIGDRCQTDVNECASSPCVNGGTCADLVNSYYCKCPRPWAGTHCDVDANECATSNGGCGPADSSNCTNTFGGYECTSYILPNSFGSNDTIVSYVGGELLLPYTQGRALTVNLSVPTQSLATTQFAIRVGPLSDRAKYECKNFQILSQTDVYVCV